MAIKLLDAIYKLPTKTKVIMLVISICFVIGLYGYAFFRPQQSELNGLKDRLNDLVRELNESKAVARELDKFKKQVEQLNIELTNALTQLPNEKEIPEILRNISALGKESKLEFTLFRPKPEEPQQFYARVPIELVVLGSYHDTGLFFDRVSKLPRIINVVNFNMTRAKETGKGKGEAEDAVRTSCLVNTYRFLEQASAGPQSQAKKSEEKKIGK